MAKRDTARDIRELPIYAIQHCGETTLEVIEGYAKKRRVTSHRIGSAFWSLVDEGQIRVEKGSDGMYYVVGED